MTRSVSSPVAAILVPVGQPLGVVVEDDGSTYLRVRIGPEIHRLDESSASMWNALHRTRPGTDRGIDRGLLAAVRPAAVTDPDREVDLLLDLGLVVEVAVSAPEVRQAFGDSYRLLPLQEILGNSDGEQHAHSLVAGGTHRTLAIDTPLRDVLIYAPREDDLYGTCYVRSGALAADEEWSRLSDPDAYLEHVLQHVHPLLERHAAYFDLALEPSPPRVHTAKAGDPGAELGAPEAIEDDSEDECLFAVGYPSGARYMWLGLESVNIRVGDDELELATDQAWLVWLAAHGKVDGLTVDDSEQTICAMARDAGVPAPIFEVDDQQLRGMVVRSGIGPELFQFAATHRLEPLLCGLGNSADEPDRYVLGIDPENPLVDLSAEQYAVWRDAHLSASLLDAARAAEDTIDLRQYLRVVQHLSVRHAAYIDQVRR